MLISHHGQSLAAGLQKAVMWPLNTTHLQLYCYLVTVLQRKPNKIFKVFFEKGSSNVCPFSEQASLYLVTHSSLTCLMWLASLCRGDSCLWPQPAFILKSLPPWTLELLFHDESVWIAMPLIFSRNHFWRLSLTMHFIFFRVPPFHGKGMVAFLCNMLILHGGTWYPEPGNYMKFPIFEVWENESFGVLRFDYFEW